MDVIRQRLGRWRRSHHRSLSQRLCGHPIRPCPPLHGSGAVAKDEERVGRNFYFRRAWIRDHLKAAPSMLQIMTVQGESMIQTLQDGRNLSTTLRQWPLEFRFGFFSWFWWVEPYGGRDLRRFWWPEAGGLNLLGGKSKTPAEGFDEEEPKPRLVPFRPRGW